jgi:prepilin-type N-terminal cleavage/methylation domain-containing protein
VNRIKNQHGFTLIELSIVMAILGILSAISLAYFNDVFARGRDAAAVSDAINLITVIDNNLLDKTGVNYESLSADGRGIGVEDELGVPRTAPVYVLSPGVKIKFFDADGPNRSYSDEGTPGKFKAWLYHSQGTPDPTNISAADVYRRCIYINIHEEDEIHTHFLF